jgi:putative PIN family toxin of toxin-antitoxin system
VALPEPLVIVFDTSVLIPLILPASRSTVLFHRLRSNGHRVAFTEPVYAELEDKLRRRETLRRWMQRSDDEISQFLTDLRTNCYLLPGFREVQGAVQADPKDDIIIAAALEASASYIVSEDRHLLDLKAYEGITIMSRMQFAAELDRLGVPA